MKRTNLYLLLVVIIGLLLRVFLALNQQILETDSPDYIVSGVNLIRGNGYVAIENLANLWFSPLYPLFIGIGSIIFDNLEILSRGISVLFGVLLIPLIYLLYKKLFGNELEALLASSLIAFYPALSYISTVAYADSLYIFLVYAFVLFGYLATKTNKFYYYLISGALIGLAYLTRHEGAGYLILFLIILVLYNFKKVNAIKLLSFSILTIIAFLLISMPYLIFLHEETGKWALTAKTNVILDARKEAIYSLDYEKINYGLNEDKTNLEIYSGKSGDVSYDQFFTKDFLSRYLKNFKDNLFLLVKIFPLLIISLIGMITRFNRAILYLILIFLYSIFLYPIFFVDERYLASAIPALAIFFLFGLFDIIKLCNNKLKGFKFPLTNNSKLFIITIVCILFLFSTLFIGIFLDSKYQKLDQATEQKVAGLWLKNYDPGSIVMARKPWVSFYSNGIFVKMPFASYQDTINYACSKNVKYLVIDERYVGSLRPQLSLLLDNSTEDMELVYDNEYNKNIKIYRLRC